MTDVATAGADLRAWSLKRADEVIATEFTDDERLDIWSKRALIRACMAVGILSEHLRSKSELGELVYLQGEADAGYAIVLRLLRDLRDYAAKEITRAGAHNDAIWVRVADVLPDRDSPSATSNGDEYLNYGTGSETLA